MFKNIIKKIKNVFANSAEVTSSDKATKPVAPKQNNNKPNRNNSSPSPKSNSSNTKQKPQPRKKKSPQSKQNNSIPKERVIPSMDGWEMPTTAEHDSDKVYFQDLPIEKVIMRAILDDLKFETCTPIQAVSLPETLAGKDVAGKAQTGTGKTAAFLITVLQNFINDNISRNNNQPFALIIAPTRELAIQIDKDCASFCTYMKLKHAAIYGGINYQKQQDLIRDGIDLVVATPGRLIDYLNKRVIDISKVSTMVIDEADRMLDMGFIPDVRRIMNRLPSVEKRQTLLFSATLDGTILDIAGSWLKNPVKLEVETENIVAKEIEERVLAVIEKEKFAILMWTLRNEPVERVLVFCNRRRGVENLYRHLKRYDVKCEMMTGDVPQKKRQRILEEFRQGETKIIIATDVAGRGIHVDGISHVINYDLPYEADDYVHRVGRTGRAGNKGVAISFACENGSFFIPAIEEYIGRELPITHPEPEMLKVEAPKHAKNIHNDRRRSGNHHHSKNKKYHGNNRNNDKRY